MKDILPGLLAGIGGIGAIGTTVGIVYPTSESNEGGINDAIVNAEFKSLKQEIEEFEKKYENTSGEYKTTILEELKDILRELLGPKIQYIYYGKSNLEIEKDLLRKRLTESGRNSFEELYKKMEEFSKLLENKREKSSEYINQLRKNN